MRIAHLSDLHLRHHLPGTARIEARRSRAMPTLLQLALDQIKLHSPDLLVVSGDLIDYPFDGFDDPATQQQGRADLELIADLLATSALPLAIVHGNHDHPALFDAVFGHFPLTQTLDGYTIHCFHDDEGPDHVPVRKGASQERFERALAETDGPPQIHVQHYIVWPERNEEYPHTYGQGAAMREAIIAAGTVRLVLSGHYHRGVPLFCDKGVYFATAEALCEAPHPFYLYDLAPDGTVTSQRFKLGENAADLT